MIPRSNLRVSMGPLLQRGTVRTIRESQDEVVLPNASVDVLAFTNGCVDVDGGRVAVYPTGNLGAEAVRGA